MAKFTDAVRATLTGYFDAGDQPTAAQFADLIQWIQEGIEEHDHSGTGDGDGVSDLVGPLTGAGLDVPDNWYIGIGAALERIVFDAAGDIAVMGANFGVGTLTPDTNAHIVRAPAGAADVAYYTVLAEAVHDANMGDGFGSSYDIAIQDIAGVTNRIARFAASRDGGADNSGKIGLYTTNAGASAIRMVIGRLGAMQWTAYGVGALTSDAAGNITAVSDVRLKEQVRNTEIGLAEVLQMQGKAWHYTKESGLETEHEYLGFIADDIEKIVPQAVGRMSDGMRTLDPNALLPAFASAIQELDVRLTKLEAK